MGLKAKWMILNLMIQLEPAIQVYTDFGWIFLRCVSLGFRLGLCGATD